MNQKTFILYNVSLLFLVVSMLIGCAQVPTSIGDTQTDVWIVVDGERVHIKPKLTAEDYIALASQVAEKMLSSREVQSWKKRPLIVAAVPENTTIDPNIITEDLQDEVISKIIESGIARVIDESSLSSGYNYIIKTTITDTVQQSSDGSRLTYYTCKLQLLSLQGERLGQWHAKIGLAKAPRKWINF